MKNILKLQLNLILNLKLTIVLVLFALSLSGCGGSTYTSGQDQGLNLNINDPVTPFDDGGTPLDDSFQSDHCRDINVGERVFYADLKGVSDREAYSRLLVSKGICTTNGNGFQQYGSYYQYEVNGGTRQCSWWNRHGMKVYINFVRNYPRAAVITIDATGDGWPTNGGQGFPTARMQFTNAVIDCNDENLTLYAQTSAGYLKIQAPKDSGNKYSGHFRGSVYFNDVLISRGLFNVTR